MTQSKLISDKSAYRQKIITLILVLFLSFFFTSRILALDLTISLGNFEPDDGIVRDLFKTSRVTTVKLNMQYYDTFDWTVGYSNQKLESKVSNLETEIKMDILNIGFEKRLTEKNDTHIIKPFIGAGWSILRIEEDIENEDLESSSSGENSNTMGSFWEIGLLGEVFSNVLIEFKLTELKVQKNIFGNVHIGGRIMSLGVRIGL